MSVALYVPLVLVGIAVALMTGAHLWNVRRSRREADAAATAAPARILVHSINDDRCTGCDACVVVCPTDVLELVSNKSRVLRFGDCIQCEQCMFACPTQALVMHWEDEEPPPLKVPNLDSFYQTAVAGMYLIGEVAGKPLVKNAANIGRAVVEHMRREGLLAGGGRASRRRAEGSDAGNVTVVDVVIVGSGPGGLSAALTCLHHGYSYVVLEKEQLVASTIARYPKGKDVMAEPYDTRNVSFLPVYDARKEELLPVWQRLIERAGVEIRRGEAVESVRKLEDGVFDVKTTVGAYRAQRVVLATGTRGKPRTLGVPGENLPKVASLLEDPDRHRGQDVLVVGGGDSAVEAACALADAGARVTLSYRGKVFSRAQAKNRERVMAYAAERKVDVLLGSQVVQLTPDQAIVRLGDGRQTAIANQAAFVLIGADPPLAWLEKLGVTYVERPHWYALGKTDQLVESLVGRQAESPRDVERLVAMVRQQPAVAAAARELAPVPEPSVVRPLPRKWTERPRTVPGALDFGAPDDVFTSAQRPPTDGPSKERPMALEEFARRLKKSRPKRRQPRGEEVTRLLRSLRDEGARLAHDETGVSMIEAAAASEVSGLSEVSALSAASGGIASASAISLRSEDLVSGATRQPPAGTLPTPAIIEGLPPRGRDGKVLTPPEGVPRRPTPGRGLAPPPPSSPAPPRAAPPPASPPGAGASKFVEARTTAADPALVARLRAETLPTSAPLEDPTERVAIEIVSSDRGDDWDDDEDATALANPELVARLRDQLRPK